MSVRLSAGAARVDITPPVGISMVGYYIREGVSQFIERPLTATALVLSSDREKIAMVSCDIAFIQDPHAADIRQRVSAEIGTRPECVILNYSHTHCGPTLPGFLWQDEAQRTLQAAYLENLKNQITGAVSAANSLLRPARLDAAPGEARIGINRREKDDTGKAFLGENPDGPADHEVLVVRVDGEDGRPIAVLYNHGCHTVTMGPKFLGLSPDYIGPAREMIERTTGALSLFLQGAAGNINPVTGLGATADDSENMTRLGMVLGAEVSKVVAGIRTLTVRGPRTFLSSLAKVSLYPFIHADAPHAKINLLTEHLALPMLPLPTLPEAQQIQAARTAAYEDAKAKGRSPGVLTVLRHFKDWSDKLCRTVGTASEAPTIPFTITALGIGDIALVALPCEPLVELGLAVKAASPFKGTLFAGYSNGCIGYVSPADAYPEGGWSPWETYAIPDMLFQSYQLPMALRPDCAQWIVDRSLALLERIRSEAV